MFTTVGHRPRTRQRMRLGAQQDGTLVAILQDVLQPTSKIDSFTENCTGVTRMLYSCPNVSTTQEVVSLNIGTPTPMRGPGTTPGLYALDAAMDDLALKLNMDPLQLRLKNYAEKDEGEKLPFSSKHLKECYQVAGGALWMGEAKSRGGFDEARERDSGLGHGDVDVACGARVGDGAGAAGRGRAGAGFKRDAGYRDGNVHGVRHRGGAEARDSDRPRGCGAGRHGTAAGPDVGRIDGDGERAAGNRSGDRQRDTVAVRAGFAHVGLAL